MVVHFIGQRRVCRVPRPVVQPLDAFADSRQFGAARFVQLLEFGDGGAAVQDVLKTEAR